MEETDMRRIELIDSDYDLERQVAWKEILDWNIRDLIKVPKMLMLFKCFSMPFNAKLENEKCKNYLFSLSSLYKVDPTWNETKLDVKLFVDWS